MDDIPERVNQLVIDLMAITVTDNGSSIFPLDLASANSAMNVAIEYVDHHRNIHKYISYSMHYCMIISYHKISVGYF